MINNIIVNIQKATRKTFIPNNFMGVDKENLQAQIEFDFDEFVDGIARVEYIHDGQPRYAFCTKANGKYQIPVRSVMTEAGRILLQLVVHQQGSYQLTTDDKYKKNKTYFSKVGETYIQLIEGNDYEIGDDITSTTYEVVDVPIFKSNEFWLYCNHAINAYIEQEEEYPSWIVIANQRLIEIEQAISETENLDIDATRINDGVEVTITKKDGTTKTEIVNDGEQGPIGPIGPQGESGVYVGDDEPTNPEIDVWIDTNESGETIPTKLSELQNDVGYITEEYHDAEKINVSDIINDAQHTDTNKPLSANMGKELQDEIDNLKARGRFLALWNSATGLPMSEPQTSPYTYLTGDYFVIGNVGSTNYKPNGNTYTTGIASTTLETENVAIDDVYYYDGTNWRLQVNTQKTISFGNIAGNPTDNSNLASALNGKIGFTNYATDSTGGAIKTGSLISVNSNGIPYASVQTYENYVLGADTNFIGKGTLENVLNARVGDINSAVDSINGEVI